MTSAICNIASNQGERQGREEATEKVELSEIKDRRREWERESAKEMSSRWVNQHLMRQQGINRNLKATCSLIIALAVERGERAAK